MTRSHPYDTPTTATLGITDSSQSCIIVANSFDLLEMNSGGKELRSAFNTRALLVRSFDTVRISSSSFYSGRGQGAGQEINDMYWEIYIRLHTVFPRINAYLK